MNGNFILNVSELRRSVASLRTVNHFLFLFDSQSVLCHCCLPAQVFSTHGADTSHGERNIEKLHSQYFPSSAQTSATEQRAFLAFLR